LENSKFSSGLDMNFCAQAFAEFGDFSGIMLIIKVNVA
jgi:hypothetical protein